jgi:hypothetical protein
VSFGHAVWQVADAEQAGFEHFLRIQRQTLQAADEDGLVVDLDPVLEAAPDLQQAACLDGEPGFLADLAGDGVQRARKTRREEAAEALASFSNEIGFVD